MAGLSSLTTTPRDSLMSTLPTAFSPFSEQQPAQLCPTSIEVAWLVTAGFGARELNMMHK
ncbi:hypothetical protein AVEN_33340-1, partial [Araneus ventricosus]